MLKKYNHNEISQNINWDDDFSIDINSDKKPFTILLPPPNVTGKLHLGHAWDSTLQDILIRYKKMNGFEVNWVSGMDHAAIATEVKVLERIKDEYNLTKNDLTKEEFLKHAWNWKEEYATEIRNQWKKIGLSINTDNECFTLDEKRSKAVKKAFVDFYNDGLIIRDNKIINWDYELQTAISNIEVDHKEVEGNLYYIKYMIENLDDHLIVATTRPETIYGDVAICINPDDERYKKYNGKRVINPLTGKTIPIINDEYVDIEFGTGALKITPFHDFNDFDIATKHNLVGINILNTDGTLNENGLDLEGINIADSRSLVIEKIKNMNQLEKIEKHIHSVGHSQRTGIVVEPMVSLQWFIKSDMLSKKVLDIQKSDNKINIFPLKFEKNYIHWLENLENWCISRQLWWGHEIPAWFNNLTGDILVSEDEPTDIENWTKETDTLDTWFSSALWPLATLDYYEDDKSLYNKFYPTSVLSTGYDILFFWVTKMSLFSLYYTNEVPFKDVILHGLIRDSQGRKMSKSLGNGIDPMEEIDKFGADSLRYFLSTTASIGEDLVYSEEKITSITHFINKLWNASKFIEMNSKGDFSIDFDESKFDYADKWIYSRLSETINKVSNSIEKYDFTICNKEIINFVWNDFCNYYIEISKSDYDTRKSLINYILLSIIKILHPFMPYVTDYLYKNLFLSNKSIVQTEWPTIIYTNNNDKFNVMLELVSKVRNYLSENKINSKENIELFILDKRNTTTELFGYAKSILNISTINATSVEIDSQFVVLDDIKVFIKTTVNISIEDQINEINTKIKEIQKDIDFCNQKLNNENFVAKAPSHIIDEIKAKLEKYTNEKQALSLKLEKINE